ncbi:MAG: DUF4214 domain-containing protein [Pseudomonadota bacterium]
MLESFETATGTSAADNLVVPVNTVAYGLEGDDRLAPGPAPEGGGITFLAGGTGQDLYAIKSGRGAVAIDTDAEDGMGLEGVALGAESTRVATVDDSHLGIWSEETGSWTLLANYEENSVLWIRMDDGLYLTQRLLDDFDELFNFVGNISAFDFFTDVAGRPYSTQQLADDIATIEGRSAAFEADEATALSRAAVEEIALLYEAAFDRDGEIDAEGFNFWVDRREDGLSYEDVAKAFIGSDEFSESVGAPGALSDEAFVAALYESVLDRPGEADGIAFWTDALAGGTGRDAVLVSFALSDENRAAADFLDTLTAVSEGVWDFA